MIGQYAFHVSEQVRCQFVKDGSLCGQVHWHGWRARTKDGTEGYIGCVCASDNFGADRIFSAETSRVRRELRIDELLSRLASFLADPLLRMRIDEATKRYRALRAEVANVRDVWPEAVMRKLQDMARAGSGVLTAEFAWETVNDDGERVREWIPATVGGVACIDVFEPSGLREIGERLKTAGEALSVAQVSRDIPERALRGWVDALGDVPRCESDLDDRQSSLDAFRRPDNRRLLCWTVANERTKEDTVAAIVELVSGSPSKPGDAARLRKAWAADLRATNQGREFRIP